MSEMEDKLNSLTPEELNALNTDPELLSAFKTKYGTHGHDTLQQIAPQNSLTQPILQGLGQATQQGFNQAGENAAQNLAGGVSIKPGNPAAPFPANLVPGLGMPSLQATPGKGVQVPPNVAAGIGTAVQMAPDIAMSMIPTGSGAEAAAAGDLGKVGRVIAGPGRQEAGAAMGAAEKAVGINTDLVPSLKDAGTALGAWRANAPQYLNALAERLNSGIPMSAQDLSLHHKMLTDLLSQEPGTLAKIFGSQQSNLGTNGVSTASKLDQMLVQQLNQAAPGRAAAAADYSAAKMRGNVYKGTAGAAMAGIGRSALLDAFKRLTGG